MTNETKGITVKIDAELHAQVREYVESHGMTMADFVSQALDNELHPKFQMKEMQTMANTRTIAFQVPEELYQRIKDYLTRNNMTQKQFFLGLVEAELERDQEERNTVAQEEQHNNEQDEGEDHENGVSRSQDRDEEEPDQGNDPAPESEEPQDIGLSM